MRIRLVRLRWNWFTLGLHCALTSHQWRSETASRCLEIVACSRCGRYQGARRLTNECRFYMKRKN